MTHLPLPMRVFVLTCLLVEFTALAGIFAGIGAGLRNLAVALGGFWPALLHGADGFYPGQALVMFATSTVIHGGPLHLGMNMLGLMWLGPMVVARLGARGFVPIAGLSALGAGGLYALLSQENIPMVGASGILFGFVGALGTWAVLDRRSIGASLRPLAGPALSFVGFNVALTLALPGTLAWEAHLGGALAGALAGWVAWQPPRWVAMRRG